MTLDKVPGPSGISFLVCKAQLAAGRTRLSGKYPNPPALFQAFHRPIRSRRCAKNTTVGGLHVCG